MDANDKVQAQIQALRDKFIAGLPGRLAALNQAFDDWQASGAGEKLDEFHRLAHSLTGAGATFGCADVSRAARDLEGYLKGLAVDDGVQQVADVDHTRQLLAVVRTVAQRAAAGGVQEPAPEPDPAVYLLDADVAGRTRLMLDLSRAGYAVESFASADDLLEAVAASQPCVILVQAALLTEDADLRQTFADLQACQTQSIPVVLLGAGVVMDEVRLNVVAQLLTPVSLEALIQILGSVSPALGPARRIA